LKIGVTLQKFKKTLKINHDLKSEKKATSGPFRQLHAKTCLRKSNKLNRKLKIHQQYAKIMCKICDHLHQIRSI